MYEYLIIGGGISGLYQAYLLQKQGVDFCLLEAESSTGGTWNSIKYQNSLYELGPNTIIDSSPELQTLISELGIEQEVLKSPLNKSTRYIYDQKRLKELKTNPLQLISSGLISPLSILKILTEPFRNKVSNKEESVREFATRKFGKEVTHKLLETFLKGVWAGDPEKLSASYALKFLVNLENKYKSIFSGLASQIFSKKDSKKKSIISFKSGLEFLTQEIANQLKPNSIKLNSKVNSITKESEHYIVTINNSESQIKTQKIIFANRAFEVAELLTDLAPELARTLNQIEYAPIALLAYTLPKNKFSKALDGFGYLSANNDTETLGTIWASELFPERNLANEYICISFIGGATNIKIKDQSQEMIWDKVIQEHIKIYTEWSNGELQKEDFKLLNIKKISKAIPQLNLGHGGIIDKLTKLQKEQYQDFYFIGNYLDGVAIKDALSSVKSCL